MKPFLATCIACSILRPEIEALRGTLERELEVRYLNSMLHMAPEHLESQLSALIVEERNRGRRVVLAYGDCCPRMLEFEVEPGNARTEGLNCCELLLGRNQYRELRKAGDFFLMPGWTLQWREIFEQELGLAPATARSLMREMHTRLLYLDTGLVPVPRVELRAAAAYTGLPWAILSVGLEELRKALEEALHRTAIHD